MSTTKYHMCIDLRGALRNWRDSMWKGCCTADDGHVMSPAEVKDHLLEQLGMGRSVIPVDSCDNFDYLEGCMGHPVDPAQQQTLGGAQ